MKYSDIYRNFGLRVFAGPQKSKRPSVSWKDDSNAVKYKDIDEIVKTNNIYGKLGDGMIVLDFDGKNWREAAEDFDKHFADLLLDKAIAVKTGSGKAHLYFFVDRVPLKLTKLIKVGKGYQVELRARKHLITLPPSIHPSGGRYTFTTPEEKLLRRPEDIKLTPYEFSLIMEYFGGLKTTIISDDNTAVEMLQDVRNYIKKNGKIVDMLLKQAEKKVTVGNRNNTLFWLSTQLRDYGFLQSEAENIVLAFVNSNSAFGTGFSVSEAVNAVKSAFSKPPRALKRIPIEVARDIFTNKYFKNIDAEINTYGPRRAAVRLVSGILRPKWRVHAFNGDIYKRKDGTYFEKGNESEFLDAINETAIKVIKYSENEDIVKYMNRIKEATIDSAYYKEIKLMLTQEETIGGDVLYVKNGKINLKTGALEPYSDDDFICSVSDVEYDPNAGLPKHFIDTIDKMFQGNERAEIQKLLGYLITPSISLRKFIVIVGSGRNGKSTLFNVIMDVLGRRFSHLIPSTFLDVNRGDLDRLYAELYGKRLAVFEEFKESTIDSVFLKTVVGNPYLTGRYIYGKPFEFQNTAKVVFLTNALPYMEFDQAVKDRLLVLEVKHRFNGNLEETLQKFASEKKEILKFLVDGAVEYYESKTIKLSEEAMKEIEDAAREMDTVGMFIEDAIIKDESSEETVIDVRKAFLKWMSINSGVSVNRLAEKYSQKWLTRHLREHGIVIKRAGKNRKRVYKGIKIQPDYKYDMYM